MGAIFEIPIQSEILTQDEVQDICGCARKSDQIDWLITNGWTFFRNRAGEPIVGRMYARLKLAGINPAAMGVPNTWVPDFSKVR
jgi:hypothetical protein